MGIGGLLTNECCMAATGGRVTVGKKSAPALGRLDESKGCVLGGRGLIQVLVRRRRVRQEAPPKNRNAASGGVVGGSQGWVGSNGRQGQVGPPKGVPAARGS